MRKVISLLVLAVIMASCSAVKVTDSWRTVDFSSLEGKKMAVIAKTNDNVIRTRIEKDMESALKASGFDAIGSYEKVPTIKPNLKLSKDQIAQVKQNLLGQDIHYVMMVVLKDKQTYLESTSSNTGYAYPGYPGFYGAGYYRGFGSYYGSMYNYGYSTTTTEEKKKYVVETVVYDLDKEEGKSLVGVVTVSIDDPSSLTKTATDLANKVVSELMKS